MFENDSGEGFLKELNVIAQEDAAGLKKAYESYGPSWKQRGGVGAFMMLARKWDRLENRVKRAIGGRFSSLRDRDIAAVAAYDIFGHIAADQRAEGVIDDVRDLRRYLMLVEAEMRARGFGAVHRDNLAAPTVSLDRPDGSKIIIEARDGGRDPADITMPSGMEHPRGFDAADER